MTLDEALRRHPGGFPYTPGDGPALNAEILTLMRSGAKRATCALPSEFTAASPMPVPGRVDIALDWSGAPACATRTLLVDRVRWCDMDAARAAAQGEFRDLEHWRQGYRAYLSRVGQFDPEMVLIYEEFELVEDFGRAG